MVKFNRILSLLAVSSFYTFVTAKPVEEVEYFFGKYESGDCKALNKFLTKQNVNLIACGMTKSNEDAVYVEIGGGNINQKVVNRIGTYSETLETVTFADITSLPKNLNLESLEVSEIRFDNSELNRNGEVQDVYIPKNVLKTAKNAGKIAIYEFNVSQKNINEIGTLTELNTLDFDGCTFDDNMDYTNLKNLKNLTELRLDTIFMKGGKMLKQLPESVCQMKKLKTLTLYRDDLTTLPKCIKNLKNLERLDVNLNELTSIPKEIGNLTKLKVANLEENEIESIPVEFGKLTKLEELNLEGNKIATLPDEFGNLANLRKLDLSYNLIGSIPTAIGSLSNLEKLNLNNNKVYRIPSSITKLVNLNSLELNDNKIKVIADAIRKLKNLEGLSIANNLLTELPEALGELQKLTFLNLAGNDVTEDDIPEALKKLTDINILLE